METSKSPRKMQSFLNSYIHSFFNYRHEGMMEMADYWLLEKDLVSKLFQVIVPRYENKMGPYTLVHKLTTVYPGRGQKNIVMELKNNPLPPIKNESARDFSGSLTNVLVRALKQEYKFKKTIENPNQR